MQRTNSLGIIDWGIGGVSIYKLVKARLGDVPIVYFSDTGATPYGKMSGRELVGRLNRAIDFLHGQNVTHLAVGCNAASTAIPFLKPGEMKIAGVIESAVETAAKMQPASLAFIGGKRTVLSAVYHRAFARRGIKVKGRIAQPLSALIESGDVSSQNLRAECRKILAPVKHCSHLLLACTHYPAIAPILQEFVSAETVLIDPAEGLVNRIRQWDLPSGGADVFFTSGDPVKMKTAARNAFSCEIAHVEPAGEDKPSPLHLF